MWQFRVIVCYVQRVRLGKRGRSKLNVSEEYLDQRQVLAVHGELRVAPCDSKGPPPGDSVKQNRFCGYNLYKRFAPCLVLRIMEMTKSQIYSFNME